MKPASYKAALYQVRRARQGPSRVDAAPLVAALRYARAGGINWRDVGRACDMDWQHVERIGNGRKGIILRATNDRVMGGLARVVAERRTALEDAAAAIDYATKPRQQPSTTWPTGPLRTALTARWGGVQSAPLSQADRRYLYRSETVDEARAERLCKEADLLPEQVWGDWFGLEETA